MPKIHNCRPIVRLVLYDAAARAACERRDVQRGVHGEVERILHCIREYMIRPLSASGGEEEEEQGTGAGRRRRVRA